MLKAAQQNATVPEPTTQKRNLKNDLTFVPNPTTFDFSFIKNPPKFIAKIC